MADSDMFEALARDSWRSQPDPISSELRAKIDALRDFDAWLARVEADGLARAEEMKWPFPEGFVRGWVKGAIQWSVWELIHVIDRLSEGRQ